MFVRSIPRAVALVLMLATSTLLVSACGGGGGTSGGGSGGGTPGTGTKLVFAEQPSDGVVGNALAPAFRVELRDASNNIVLNSGVEVTLGFALNPGGATLGGTLTKSTITGVAIFDDITVNNAASGYALRATATSLTSALSTTFNVSNPAAPAALNITTEPTDIIETNNINPSVKIEIVDSNGARVTSATNPVVASIGTNPVGGTLSGTTTRTPINGVVTFNDLNIDGDGNGYTLQFTSSGLTSATSATFNVEPLILEFVYINIPAQITEEETIPAGIRVEIRNQNGTIQSNRNDTIILSLGTNPSGASLSGTSVVQAVDGVAIFNNVMISEPGEGFQFSVTAAGIPPLESPTFDVRSTTAASVDAKVSYTTDDLQHFLIRTQWAFTDETLAEVQNTATLGQYIDSMLTATTETNLEAVAENDYLGRSGDTDFPARADIARWWNHLMLETNNPFREVMALFWHDHFALSSDAFAAANLHFVPDHINILRQHYAGDFRQMLYDISVDPAMLRWLDGIQSRVNNINENYARELWELFTLGVDNGYTQQDIEEAARCLTGFRERNDPVTGLNYTVYESGRHDTGNKTIFGQTITGRSGTDGINEYWDVIDLTLDNKPVEDFICRKLCEHFVYPDPEEDLVKEFGKTLRENNWELAPLLKQMFLSKAFYSDKAKQGIVKSPVDYTMGLIRSTGLKVREQATSPNYVYSALLDAGHQPSSPPNVNGWPGGVLWLSADNMVQRANLANRVIVERNYQINTLGLSDTELLPGGTNTAEEVVDHWAVRMRVDLNTTERDSYVHYLNSDVDGNGNEVSQPWDPASAGQLTEKLRGLIYILSQHPSYQLR